MKLQLQFSVVALLLCLNSFAQSPQLKWAGLLDGDNTRFTNKIVADQNGNSYAVGGFQGTIDVDPGPSTKNLVAPGIFNGLIVKLNAAGELVWAKQIAASVYTDANSVAVDESGTVTFGGSFFGTADLDPGINEEVAESPTGYSSYVVRLDSNGDLVWATSFTGNSVGIFGMSVDANDNTYIGGQFSGSVEANPTTTLTSAGSSDILIIKLDDQGDVAFAGSVGGPGDESFVNLGIDNLNNIVVGGHFSGTADFDPSGTAQTMTAVGSTDVFLLQLNSAGLYQWAKQIGATQNLDLRAFAVDPTDGSIAYTGMYSNTTVDFDPNSGVVNLIAINNDIFMAKLSSAGTFVFAETFAGPLSYEETDAITIDNDGNIYLAGLFQSVFDIDPDGAVTELISHGGGQDMFLAKFDSNGVLLWNQPMPATDVVRASYISTDATGNIYVTGDFNETVNFGTGICTTGKFARPDNATPFVIRLDALTGTTCFGFIEQPTSSAVGCALGTIVLNAPAGGTSQIKYQWEYFNGTVWADVVDQEADAGKNGYEGSKTAYLTVETAEGTGIIDFRCRVTGKDIAASIYSNTANLVIVDKPALPGVVSTSGCGFGTYSLKATGGTNGEYRWLIDGDVIDGETDDTYSMYLTGSLVNFSVALDVAGCQGDEALVPINTEACAPTPGLVWAQRFGPGLLKAEDMALDNSGNIIVTGTFFNPVTFGSTTLTPVGTYNYYIVKLDPAGNVLWARQTSVRIFDVAISANGDIVYAGTFTGTGVDLDPTVGVSPATANGDDLVFVKLLPDGSFSLAKQLPGTGTNLNIARGVTVDIPGNIYITGTFTGTVDFDPSATSFPLASASSGGPDIFVAKYTSLGALTWAKRMGSTAFVERGYEIKVDGTGNVYTVGVFQSTVDFDPNAGVTNISSAGATDGFIQKLNSAGNLVWVKTFGAGSTDEVVSLALDNAGNPHITGQFTGTVDFDPGSGSFPLSSSSSASSFIVKLAGDGSFVWAGLMRGETTSVFVDGTGNVLTTGSHDRNADFDPGTSIYPLYVVVNTDAFVSQLTSSGNFSWAYNLNSSGLSYFDNSGTDIAVDVNGNIYTSGIFWHTSDFDPGHCTYPLSVAVNAGGEGFLQKVRPGIATICFNPEPKDIAGCFFQKIDILAEATGTTNIHYQWQVKNTTTSLFENLTNAGGYTGVTTSQLTIQTTADFGYGTYRVIAGGDNAPDKISSESVVTLGTPPAAPGVTGTTSCASGDFILTATGTTDGNYNWYADLTDGSLDEVNHDGAYNTGFIDASVTYYVAIFNGSCESARIPVMAEITFGFPDPVATSASSCNTNVTLTLSATGASSNPSEQYYWFDQVDSDIPLDITTGSFTTPELTVTTTYYVAISDGICESQRVAVVATVGDAAPPDVAPQSRCGSGTVAFNASGGTDGQYQWFNDLTGAAIAGEVNHTFTTPVLTATTTYYVALVSGTCTSARIAAVATVTSCTTNQPPAIVTTTSSIPLQGSTTIDLNPLISDPDGNLDKASLRIVVQPASGANASIDQNGQLIVDYAGIPFIGQDQVTIEICDTAGSCVQQVIIINVSGDVNIFNAVSPNGDNKNDVFYLQYINTMDDTKENKVTIFNRWGDVVFEVNNYDNSINVFKGLNNKGNELASGTYYFKVDFASGRSSRTGYLSLKR